MITRKNILNPEDWGLNHNLYGELLINHIKLTDLAKKYDTPLYVFNEKFLSDRAKSFKNSAEKIFSSNATVFYPFKCNSVPAIVNTIKEAGLSAEVMTEFELDLALNCGFNPGDIIVNGPCKTDKFIFNCLTNNIGMLIIDSISELRSLSRILNTYSHKVNLLLRVNPDYIPKGLSKSSATGSKSSSFGLNKNQILEALLIIKNNSKLNFKGLHFHIGTGIRDPKAYSGVIKKLYTIFKEIKEAGLEIKVLDVGGGYASMTTRELSSFEMVASQILRSYELKFGNQIFYSFEDYMKEINNAIVKYFGSKIPKIFFEPGRSLTSPSQLLLLTVHRIKQRDRQKWLITDGGLGTITMPTYYEYHEMFLCNEFNRKQKEKVTITGPCCFASDLVYKNKILPQANEGEVLALMDTGAYFNALESSFNFNKPAILSVNGNQCKIVRRRETFQDMIARDRNNQNFLREETYNEIHSC